MAQVGFPWNVQSRPRDSVQISEKEGQLAASEPTSEGVVYESINKPENKLKTNGSAKRKIEPIKTTAAARQIARVQSERPRVQEAFRRLPVRTIPPWVQDADEDDLLDAGLLLPQDPNTALVAHHHHTPSDLRRPPNGPYPTSSGEIQSEPTSRWISFARASAYPRENFQSEKVDPEWLNENFTDYSKPWLADHNDDDVEDGSDKYRAFRRKRRVWYKRVHVATMRNPFVPLVFRLFVITFAATAMALGASIYHENNIIIACIDQPQGSRNPSCAGKVGQGQVDYNRDPSALMAILIDAVAIVYSVYITYDEYFSKPLGLRRPRAKVRLVLLDLFFIVFQSANLSLAFNSIAIEQGPCKSGSHAEYDLKFDKVCDRAQALSAMLFVSLVAWLLTFSVSILRLVERMSTRS